MNQAIVYLFHVVTIILVYIIFNRIALSRNSAINIAIMSAILALSGGTVSWFISDPQDLFADFTGSYYRASAVLENPEKLRDIMGPQIHGLVNLPVLAYVFAPLGLMQFPVAISLFDGAALVGVCVSCLWLAREARLSATDAGLYVFIVASFGPLLYSLKEGNASTLVLPMLVGAFLLQRRANDFAAGALLGAAALLKTPLLLFGLYFLLRRRWRGVIGGAVVCLGALVVSLALFGWQMHVDWYRICIEPYSKLIFSAYNSQSIWSAFARLERAGADDWIPRPLGAGFRITVIMLLLAVVSALLWLGSKQARPTSRSPAELTAYDLEFLAVLVLCVIASPLAWAHYYTWLLIPLAFLFGPRRISAESGAADAAGKMAILLTGLPVFLDMTWGSHVMRAIFVRIGVSLPLIGACLLLAVIIWQLAERARAFRPAESMAKAAVV